MRPQARHPRRGTTLLEVMTVVAIIGIMSAMGGSAISDMVTSGRVVSSTKGLMASLGAARLRAASSNCPHYVQVNGPTYAGTGSTGFPSTAATISIMRKGNCASGVIAFEPGDRLVDSDRLGPDELPGSVQLLLPTTLLSTEVLATQSLSVGYDRLGARWLWFDSSGAGQTGFAEVTSFSGLDVNLTLHERATPPHHSLVVVLPSAGAARLQ